MTSMITNLFKRFPLIFICVGLSLVLGILIYLRTGVHRELVARQEKMNAQLDVIIRNQSQGAELAGQLQELKRLTAGMEGRLMVTDDKAFNSQFFYDIETRSHATISDLRQTPGGQGDGSTRGKLTEFTSVGFNMTVSGRAGYVISFLKRIENGKYFTRCNSVVLKGNPTVGPDGIDATMKLEVLAKKQ